MPKKLLVTASSYEHIRIFHMPYLHEFKKLGFEVHVVAAGMPDKVPYTDRAYNQIFNKQGGKLGNLRTASFLRKLILRERYDLIITHTTLAAFVTRMAVLGMRKRPKLVYMCHGYLFSDDMPWHKNLFLRSAERFLAGVTDLLLIMNSYDYKAAVKHRYGKRIEFIPGIGVDFSHFDHVGTEDRERLRRQYSIADDEKVIIYPAEFSGRKSQSFVIDAMEYLPEHVVMVLPGAGVLFDECVSLAKKTGKRIIFPGYINDIYSWYEMADIAVTSARTEGLPFNVMEAMYMGLPVVASAVKGHMDLIKENETGLLFKYGDPHGCAAQVQKLVDDPALCQRLSANAKSRVGKYSLEEVLPQVMGHYLSEVTSIRG
jgi:glycosyltransferase EpsD